MNTRQNKASNVQKYEQSEIVCNCKCGLSLLGNICIWSRQYCELLEVSKEIKNYVIKCEQCSYLMCWVCFIRQLRDVQHSSCCGVKLSNFIHLYQKLRSCKRPSWAQQEKIECQEGQFIFIDNNENICIDIYEKNSLKSQFIGINNEKYSQLVYKNNYVIEVFIYEKDRIIDGFYFEDDNSCESSYLYLDKIYNSQTNQLMQENMKSLKVPSIYGQLYKQAEDSFCMDKNGQLISEDQSLVLSEYYRLNALNDLSILSRSNELNQEMKKNIRLQKYMYQYNKSYPKELETIQIGQLYSNYEQTEDDSQDRNIQYNEREIETLIHILRITQLITNATGQLKQCVADGNFENNQKLLIQIFNNLEQLKF